MILEELERIVYNNYDKRVFRIGQYSSGALESLEDLEDAIELIETGAFAQIQGGAGWVLQRFINNERGNPVRVSVISTSLVHTLAQFRLTGVELLRKAIAALEHGSLTLAESGSDADIELDPFDLATLHDAFEKGETRGHFTLVGLVR